MTTASDSNAEMFDAIVESHENSWYKRGCAIGQFVASLEPGEYRTRVVGRLADVDNVGHSALIHAIRATGGPTFRADSMRRHRLCQCACSETVRAP